MASINIRRDVDDKYYRYKMPPIIAKVEGKGNGIKTVVPNMLEIGKALNRPPSYPTKFFGCELGAQVICDEKNNRYIVNGCHEAYRLQEILDGFISKFVLCPSCKNPETELVISKDSVIFTECKACGQKRKTDQTHKLVTHILKSAVTTKSKKKDKEDVDESSEVEAHEADQVAAASVVNADGSVLLNMVTSFEDNLSIVPPEEDTKADEDDNATQEEAIEELAAFVAEGPKSAADLLAKIDEHALKRYKAVAVYIQVVFNEKFVESLPKHIPILKALVKDAKCQKGLLGGLERALGLSFEGMLSKLPVILKRFYEADVLEEDVLIYWADHPSKKFVGNKEVAKKVRLAAAPFIDWLREAESEDSDEDDA